MGVLSNVENSTKVFGAFMVLGLTGLLFLIVFGNLSTNLGFAAGTQGFNDTENVIGNLTTGVATYFTFANVWFTLLAVVLLIIIVMGVIGVVQSRDKGGFSN